MSAPRSKPPVLHSSVGLTVPPKPIHISYSSPCLNRYRFNNIIVNQFVDEPPALPSLQFEQPDDNSQLVLPPPRDLGLLEDTSYENLNRGAAITLNDPGPNLCSNGARSWPTNTPTDHPRYLPNIRDQDMFQRSCPTPPQIVLLKSQAHYYETEDLNHFGASNHDNQYRRNVQAHRVTSSMPTLPPINIAQHGLDATCTIAKAAERLTRLNHDEYLKSQVYTRQRDRPAAQENVEMLRSSLYRSGADPIAPLKQYTNMPGAVQGTSATAEDATSDSTERRPRAYVPLTRELYRAMELSLQTPNQPVFPPDFTNKRWRRLMSYYQYRPENPVNRTLTWRKSQSYIAPKEDWNDIILEYHRGTFSSPLPEHRTLTQTYKKLDQHYQTRRSRSGITYDLVKTVISQCSCQALGPRTQ